MIFAVQMLLAHQVTYQAITVSQKMFSVCQSVSRHVSLYLRHELNVPNKELHRHPLGEGEGGRFKMIQKQPNLSYSKSLSVTSVEFTSIQML